MTEDRRCTGSSQSDKRSQSTNLEPEGLALWLTRLRQQGVKVLSLNVEKDFFIIADEIYEKIVYDENRHFSIASASRQARDLTITINGWSKSHAMTGWRIGFSTSMEIITEAMDALEAMLQ